MLAKLLAATLILMLSAASALAATSEASRSQGWLRIYQYKHKLFGGYESSVKSERFFFSPQGPKDPEAEMHAAIQAYESGAGKYGTQNQPAACVFPARKKVLERLLKRQFPSPKCKDLTDWVSRLNADRVSVVFVGAYAGNPASILGHTFLRLYNREREASGREGIDLLSYAVGYMAQADPTDNRMMYMLKGLTGGYPGFYELEPHYMKVGLYNNSESRDLWDLKLDLTKDETELLVEHLWELTFNAKFDYFFLDENCSYRLITILEAIRPTLDVSQHLSTIVLPAETVRALEAAGVTEGEAKFRSSIRRRLGLKLAELSSSERSEFDLSKRSVAHLNHIDNPTVVDALLDHWVYENYKAHAKLDRDSSSIMEATYLKASELKDSTRFHMNDKNIHDRFHLMPPFQGHKPKWLEARGGFTKVGATAGLSYRSGVHPNWSGDRGYEDVSVIEYLGIDVDWRDTQTDLWSLLFVGARSIEGSEDRVFSMAWDFTARATNDCYICRTNQAALAMSGGAGLAARWQGVRCFFIADVSAATWEEEGAQGLLAPGVVAGAKWLAGRWTLTAEARADFFHERKFREWQARLNHQTTTNINLFVQTKYRDLSSERSEAASTAGLAAFFD